MSSKKALQRPQTTGVKALDNYIYDYQLSLAALLLPARNVLRQIREIMEIREAGRSGRFILDQEGFFAMRDNIQHEVIMITELWEERYLMAKEEKPSATPKADAAAKAGKAKAEQAAKDKVTASQAQIDKQLGQGKKGS